MESLLNDAKGYFNTGVRIGSRDNIRMKKSSSNIYITNSERDIEISIPRIEAEKLVATGEWQYGRKIKTEPVKRGRGFMINREFVTNLEKTVELRLEKIDAERLVASGKWIYGKKSRKSTYGTVINRNGIIKRVPESEVDDYLFDGWHLGRK